MRTWFSTVLLTSILGLIGNALWLWPAHAAAASTPTASAARLTQTIKIDGDLNDPAWQHARQSSGFVRRFPNPGTAADHATKFAVLYDDRAIYVGVWVDDDPAQVRGPLMRRDEDGQTDSVTVAFDSYHDKRTAFVFGLTPGSIQSDSLIFDDAEFDDTWDAVWAGASKIVASGWTAEFRIPLSQLRYTSAASQSWGMQVVRKIARTGEEDVWAPWQRADQQVVSKFGTLTGLVGIPKSQRLELLPYITGGGSRLTGESVHGVGAAGLDLKYGISSAFTLSATINPDFGQVQADPSQVNLSANELFFAERRPFFLEGTELFSLPLGEGGDSPETVFYSRRIGTAPHITLDGDNVEQPRATTILGAAKLTGKQHGWSVGLLSALTSAEHGAFTDADGVRQRQLVEPLTNYSVARLRRDLRDGNTTVGAFATSTIRNNQPATRDLVDQAFSYGGDLNHRWAQNRYQATLSVVGSTIRGNQDAIAAVQNSPRHWFGRPDAKHLSLDGGRAMTGAGYAWGISQIGHSHWRYGLGGEARSPDLEVNDLGYQRNSDVMVNWIWSNYRQETPTAGLLRYSIDSALWLWNDTSPRLGGFGGNVNANVVTHDYWSLGSWLNVERQRWDAGALRGGTSLRGNTSMNGGAWWNSDERKKVRWNVGLNGGTTPASASWNSGANIDTTWQARSNLVVGLGVSASVSEDDQQYVSELDVAARTQYVFARVRQVTAATTLRTSWTLSPDLSLQIYAQPFFATGAYSGFKDADNPAARNYDARYYTFAGRDIAYNSEGYTILRDRNGPLATPHAIGNPNFDVAELRSTVVLRWQYRPGSTLFAIWAHNSGGYHDDGEFRLADELRLLANADHDDTVMLKLNYWYGL